MNSQTPSYEIVEPAKASKADLVQLLWDARYLIEKNHGPVGWEAYVAASDDLQKIDAALRSCAADGPSSLQEFARERIDYPMATWGEKELARRVLEDRS